MISLQGTDFHLFFYEMDYITQNVARGKTGWIQCEMKARGRLGGDSKLTPEARIRSVKLTFTLLLHWLV